MNYVAILRGINVTGKNKVPMAELRNYLSEAGYQSVSTYIQSGNIAFTTDDHDQKQFAQDIKALIAEKFSYDVPVIVLNADELKEIQANNPFISRPGIDVQKLHVTFLAEEPTPEKAAPIVVDNYLPDEFIFKNKVIYLHCPGGYGKTKLNNSFFEKKLGVTATTRNWKTVGKLLEMIS